MAIEEDPPQGVPEWVVTFGDMMSLLLTFFIMLVSMSELRSESRVAQAIEALKRQFGRDAQVEPGAVRQRGPRVEAPRGDRPLVTGIRPGTQIMAGGTIFFEPGSDHITQAAQERFAPTLNELRGKMQRIEIRGHAAQEPSDELDTWDLAYRRTRAVLALLIAEGIESERIRLGVAGTNEPHTSSGDAWDLRQNSRVEVFMLNEFPHTIPTTGAGTTPSSGAAAGHTPTNDRSAPKPSTAAEPEPSPVAHSPEPDSTSASTSTPSGSPAARQTSGEPTAPAP